MTARTNDSQTQLGSALAQIDEAMALCAKAPSVTDDTDALAEIRRADNILCFVASRIKATDIQLTPLTRISAVNDKLIKARAQLQLFEENKNPAHAQNANIELEECIVQAALLPVIRESIEGGDLVAALTRSKDLVDSQMSALKQRCDALAGEIAASNASLQQQQADISAERSRLTNVTAEYQQQFSNAQDNRSTVFGEKESERQKAHQEAVAALEARAKEQMEKLDGDVAALRTTYQGAGEGVLAEMAKQKIEVEKLVGVIGNVGLTSGYVKAANEAKGRSYFWQFITVTALVALIAIGLAAFWPVITGGQSPTLTWENLATRIFVAITVGVLAAYAAVQGDRNLELERRNRRLALELEALGPFLAVLPPDKQIDFRIEVGRQAFAKHEDSAKHESPANVVALLKSKELRAFIIELVKAAKSE